MFAATALSQPPETTAADDNAVALAHLGTRDDNALTRRTVSYLGRLGPSSNGPGVARSPLDSRFVPSGLTPPSPQR